MTRKWLWWAWPAFLLAFLVGFAVLEGIAFEYLWTIGQKWPLSLVLWGMVVGGLSVHFFWNWNPKKGDTNG